jgi:hypothetical protein
VLAIPTNRAGCNPAARDYGRSIGPPASFGAVVFCDEHFNTYLQVPSSRSPSLASGATGLGFWMLFAKSHQECAFGGSRI